MVAPVESDEASKLTTSVLLFRDSMCVSEIGSGTPPGIIDFGVDSTSSLSPVSEIYATRA